MKVLQIKHQLAGLPDDMPVVIVNGQLVTARMFQTGALRRGISLTKAQTVKGMELLEQLLPSIPPAIFMMAVGGALPPEKTKVEQQLEAALPKLKGSFKKELSKRIEKLVTAK